MKQSDAEWRTGDGLRLFAWGWQPDSEPLAVVCLVHGLGEHVGRYGHVAEYLIGERYASLGFDLRGHGRSEGQRGHAASYEALMDDVGLLLVEASLRFPSRPRFLYGHSFGGALALNFALRRRPSLAGVVATGPLLRPAFPPPAWKLALARAMAGLWPTLSMSNEVDPEAVSRDPAVVRAYANDPLVHNRLSARLGLDLLAAGEWALAHAAEFPLPLLLMHGSADRVTSPEASREFAARAGSECTFQLWDGLYHEVHNEPEQRDVFAFLGDWLVKAT